jgi:hypothetical protein
MANLRETTLYVSPNKFVTMSKIEHVRDDGSIGLTLWTVKYEDTLLPMQNTEQDGWLLCSLLTGDENLRRA